MILASLDAGGKAGRALIKVVDPLPERVDQRLGEGATKMDRPGRSLRPGRGAGEGDAAGCGGRAENVS